MNGGADRLHDQRGDEVAGNRRERCDAEEQDEDRGHQRAPAHPGESHCEADDQPGQRHIKIDVHPPSPPQFPAAFDAIGYFAGSRVARQVRSDFDAYGRGGAASNTPSGAFAAVRPGDVPYPQTSAAVSTMRRSLATSSSYVSMFPSTVEEKPHCGERQSCSSGTNFAASSMRRLRSSFVSSAPRLVVTRPRTTYLSLGT